MSDTDIKERHFSKFVSIYSQASHIQQLKFKVKKVNLGFAKEKTKSPGNLQGNPKPGP